MRELERHSDTTSAHAPTVGVMGRGRLGRVLSAGLRAAGVDASEPLARGAGCGAYEVVLLCVPDSQIAAAAALIAPGPLVGHCSGATGLEALAPHEHVFSLHPLMTVTERDGPERLAGAGAGISGSSPRARRVARELAERLGLRPFPLAEEDRAAYHAAASIASNFLVTLEAAAERVAAGTGADRELLAPLVRATAENWASLGPANALTGPVARGDKATVAAQREAVAERAPELVDLFDVLVAATHRLAGAPGSAPREMRTVSTVADLRAALAPARRRGQRIGLVPTMGAMHAGHLSLIRAARAECDLVVVSLFVNPAQFDDPGDLLAYPRDEAHDAALAAGERTDVLFAPSAQEVYPDGFSTTVSVALGTDRLEGASRGRAHFDGVTTVVGKLLNMVGPEVAYLGQKDAQQAAVIRRMVRDLDLPVRIEVCPTVRDADGLALSSRNALLSAGDRARATALSRALAVIAEAAQAGERDPDALLAPARSELERSGLEPDYLELVSPDDFEPVRDGFGEALAVVAARVGATRLIDNLVIHPVPAAATATATATASAVGEPEERAS